MKNLQKRLITSLVAVLTAVTAMAQTPYDEGQKALRQQAWMEAAEHFEQAFDSDRADAAMYWRAHALYKASRKAEAARQIRELEVEYPDSRWVNEAHALQIEYEGATDNDQFDEELRLLAMSRLMERNPERTLPLVLKLMRETDSPKIRNDALFLLGISESPEALAEITEIARESDDPRFQAEAINILAMTESEESMKLLASLYSESADRRVRQAVIHAHIITESAEPLLGFLRTEQDPALQREIVYALGAMEATSELGQLYAGFEDRGVRMNVLEALMIAEDADALLEVLETEKDPVLRRQALEMLAVMDSEAADEALFEILESEG